MISKNDILNLDKKGIETLFNSKIATLTITDIEPTRVKRAMLEELKKHLDDFNIRNIDYHYNQASFSINKFEFKMKISVKSTGKIVKVTKLKSKTIKGIGGFKIDAISFRPIHLHFDFENEKTLKIKIHEKCSSTIINDIDLSKINCSIKDFYSPEKMIELSDAQEQGYIDCLKNRNKAIDDYKGFRHNIELTIAQPVLKRHMDIIWNANVKKSKLSFIPNEYQYLIPKNVNHTNIFETIVNVVSVINSELVDDVINKIFPQDALYYTKERI